jgi:hypothetical protein
LTLEESHFFNLARQYAEHKHGFILKTLDRSPAAYILTFNDPNQPKHMTRGVAVFEDQFREAVAANELSPGIRRNIDEALS